MTAKKEPLNERLDGMADDIQIGGHANFKALSLVAFLCKGLTSEQRRRMGRFLARARRLIRDMNQFWRDYPVLDEIVDRGSIAAGCEQPPGPGTA